VLLNDSDRSIIVRLFGYKLARYFARFVMGVLGVFVFGERENVGELGPGDETGEKFRRALGGVDTG
jgi:hypothetical protein